VPPNNRRPCECCTQWINVLDNFVWLYEHGDAQEGLQKVYAFGQRNEGPSNPTDSLAQEFEAAGFDSSCIDDMFSALEWWEQGPGGICTGPSPLNDVLKVLNLARRLKAKGAAGEPTVVGGTWKWSWLIGLRIALGFLVLIVSELMVVLGAWYWSQGDNLWQKCLNSWPYLGATFVAWAFLLRAILGRAFWQHLKRWKGGA
jgi:hypothetical protein